MKLILDTAIVGRLCHRRKHRDVRAWFLRVVREHDPLLSEVVDYELRRELVRIGAVHGLSRLDELAREIRYLPVTTDTWQPPRVCGHSCVELGVHRQQVRRWTPTC